MITLIRKSAMIGFLLAGFFLDAASAQRSPTVSQRSADWQIIVANKRISIKAQDAPLEQVLRVIGQKSAVQIVAPSVGDASVSDEFNNLTLEAAVRRLLGQWNIAYFYSWRAERAGMPLVLVLSAVRVFDRNGGAKSNMGVVVKQDCQEPRLAAKNPAPRDPEIDAEAARWSQRLVASVDEKSREQSAARLGKLGTPASIDLLSRVATENPDYSMRLAAVNGLGKSWSDDSVAPLSRALLEDDDAVVRESAARGLGQSWSEAAVQPLLTALLNDRDPVVREQAARALGRVAGDEAVGGLTQALNQDRRWYVREAAARALGSVGGREAAESLNKASTYHRDRSIRETAMVTVMNMDHGVSTSSISVPAPASARCADGMPLK